MGTISRRDFLSKALGGTGGYLALSTAGIFAGRACLASDRDFPDRVLADLHVHPMLNDIVERSPLGMEAGKVATGLARRLMNPTSFDWQGAHEARVDLVCAAHYSPFDELFTMVTDPAYEAPAHMHWIMDQLEADLHGHNGTFAQLVTCKREMLQVVNAPRGSPEYRIAVVHTIEGGQALGLDLDQVGRFARRGVAILTVTHFFTKGIASAANPFPYFSDSQGSSARMALTEFGEQLIPEMERCGMIVDVTHCTDLAVSRILEISKRPVVATHSSPLTLGDHAYSMHDEHIQEIGRRGGLIGIICETNYLNNFGTVTLAEAKGSLHDVVRAIRYVCDLAKTHRCVAVGTDFSGYIHRLSDVNQIKEIGKLHSLLMSYGGFSRSEADDIVANNAINFLASNWGPQEPSEACG